MKIFSLSPETKYKFAKFKKNRKSYYSLVIFMALFLFTLPAELLFNDKPLVMSIDGRLYFPIFRSYTMKDFGGGSDIPIQNYNSGDFVSFIDGKVKKVDTKSMFGSGGDDLSLDDLESGGDKKPEQEGQEEKSVVVTEGKKHDFWRLDALFTNSYKSGYNGTTLERQNLASPKDYVEKKTGKEYKGSFDEGYYLGTDTCGKCVLARLVYGFRVSIIFGLALAISGTIVGCFLGALQGYFGGLVDLLGQRLTEIWGSIPELFLLMILASIFNRNTSESTMYFIIFGILNLFVWMGMASHMRAMFLRARNLDYVKAAKALGVSDFKIMIKHIMPNSLVPIVTFFPFAVSAGFMELVSLDFIGLGIKYPAPSLGELLSQGEANPRVWWIIVPTFIVLVLVQTLLTYIGDGVRNAFDPRYKG